MKKSLSFLIAASAAVALIPLSLADSMSSSSSSAMSSSSMSAISSSMMMSSSSSSDMSQVSCADKKNLEKVLCMNDASRKSAMAKFTMNRSTTASKVQAVVAACADKKGMEKAVCIRRIGTAVVKKADQTVTKMNAMMNKLMVPASCMGKRAKDLTACIMGLSKGKMYRNMSSMSSMMSSSTSSSSSMMSSSSSSAMSDSSL